jgi:microcystin-dependent protein
MANYEATRYDFDGANLTGIEGIPTATIIPWSTASVPSGFLECNGQAVSRSTYATLFAIVSTTYGAGDGSTTFNVPDLQDNVPLGKSGTKPVASTGGANTSPITGNVAGSTANATLSTAQLASHTHPGALTALAEDTQGNEAPQRPRSPTQTGAAGSGQGHSHNMSANFSGDAASVLQPYLTIMYVIKT